MWVLPAGAVTTVVMVVVPLVLSAILPEATPDATGTPFTVIIALVSPVIAFWVTLETEALTDVT